MSVYRLKDGRWIVQYRDPNRPGKYKREYFGRGLEAEKRARERDRELKERTRQGKTPELSAPLFEELANAYLQAKKNKLAKSTIMNMYYKLKGVILPLIGDMNVLTITPSVLERYEEERTREGVKKTTIHRELTDIITIINWAVKRGYIYESPLRGYEKPRRDDEVIMPPSVDEINRILACSPAHLIRAICISYYTGLRPGAKELFGLRWSENVDWSNQCILVRSADKGGLVARMVPVLDENFWHEMKRWYELDKSQSVEYIVHYKGKPVKSLKRAFNTAKRKAGITRRLRLYDFRHAFTTHLLAKGAQLKPVSEMIGHKDIETTLRVYQHTNTPIMRDTAQLLPGLSIPDTTIVVSKEEKNLKKQ